MSVFDTESSMTQVDGILYVWSYKIKKYHLHIANSSFNLWKQMLFMHGIVLHLVSYPICCVIYPGNYMDDEIHFRNEC